MHRFLQLCVWGMTCVALAYGQSNCWVNSDCDDAPNGYTATLIDFEKLKLIKVCCPGYASRFFKAGHFPRPWCRCDYEILQTESTCWKGEQCCECPLSSAGFMDDMPVCCSRCRAANITDPFTGEIIQRLKFDNETCSC